MNIKIIILLIVILALTIYILNTNEHFQETINSLGDIQVNNLTVGGSMDIFPSGLIVAWYGNINEIPDGWILCDGTLGTPDLTNNFVLGAGLNRKLGQMGGSDKHILSINELPQHNHFVMSSISTSNTLTQLSATGITNANGMTNTNTIATTGETGGDIAHNNMPPYFVLSFIQKL